MIVVMTQSKRRCYCGSIGSSVYDIKIVLLLFVVVVCYLSRSMIISHQIRVITRIHTQTHIRQREIWFGKISKWCWGWTRYGTNNTTTCIFMSTTCIDQEIICMQQSIGDFHSDTMFFGSVLIVVHGCFFNQEWFGYKWCLWVFLCRWSQSTREILQAIWEDVNKEIEDGESCCSKEKDGQ